MNSKGNTGAARERKPLELPIGWGPELSPPARLASRRTAHEIRLEILRQISSRLKQKALLNPN